MSTLVISNPLPELHLLTVQIENAMARVIISNGPLNLMDGAMVDELDRLGQWLAHDDQLNVVLFESGNPDFFIAHADLHMLASVDFPAPEDVSGPSPHQLIVDRFRTLPQVTIGKLAGIARGGGSEFLLALDMRFGAIGRSVLGQPEVALGFPPGCGATQRLPRLVGRAHAIEIILGAGDFSALEAERMGWLNRALPSEELDEFVDDLARRIASYPRTAIVQAKAAIDAGTPSFHDGFAAELTCFVRASGAEGTRARLEKALTEGFQTKACERAKLDPWLLSLGTG